MVGGSDSRRAGHETGQGAAEGVATLGLIVAERADRGKLSASGDGGCRRGRERAHPKGSLNSHALR